MFFKKNKPEKPQASGQQASSPFEPSVQVSDSFSLFAPSLNTPIAPIDFGFDSPTPASSYAVPAPPPDSMSYPKPIQSQWNDSQASASEDFMTPSPSAENWASSDETSPLGWEDAAAPSGGMNVSMQSSPPQHPTYLNETFENYVPQSSSDTTAAWSAPAPMAETFDPSLFQFEPAAPFENPDLLEVMPPFMPSDSFGQSLQSDSLASSADLTGAFESSIPYGPEPTIGNAMGELMPWEQSMPVTEKTALIGSQEALWQNLDSSDTLPGEQVPLAPGAMMDTLHQKIYPDDPFHTDPAAFLEGQQAFEDAAQFLFPDTMKAPLNWQEDSTAPIHYNQPAEFPYLTENGFESAPMDLGPSIQSSSSSFSEITSLYPEEAQLSVPQAATSFLPADDPFDFSLDANVETFSSVEAASLLPELEWPSFESLASIEDDFAASPLQDTPFEAEQATFQELEPTADLYAEPFGLNSVELSSGDSFFQTLPSLSDGDETVFTPFVPEVPNADSAPVDLMSLMASDDGYESEISFETQMPLDLSDEFTMGGVENLAGFQPEPVMMPQILSDQDFYATDFTLNEYGELIPASLDDDDDLLTNPELASEALQGFLEMVPESVSPVDVAPNELGFSAMEPVQQSDLLAVDFWEMPPPMELEAMPASVDDEEPLFPTPQQFAIPEAPSVMASSFLEETSEGFTELAPASLFSESSLPPVLPVHPSEPLEVPVTQFTEPAPTPLSTPKIQQPQHSPAPLESQEQSEPAADSKKPNQPSPVNSPDEFLLANLQVWATCPLAADRRLLLVSSKGVFALMGQVSLEQPQISVLKIFENNPLAYQNTFTAVAEAQAATQGMFVTQVGTWHAIVSTYQDKITLHTELG